MSFGFICPWQNIVLGAIDDFLFLFGANLRCFISKRMQEIGGFLDDKAGTYPDVQAAYRSIFLWADNFRIFILPDFGVQSVVDS